MKKSMLFIFATFLGISSGQSNSDNSSLYRLPTNVWPESYDISLLTNVTRGDFTYKGQVSIDLRVAEETNKVVVHSEKLKIIKEQSEFIRHISGGKFESVKINSQHYDEETQFYTLTFLENLIPGRYILALHFIGEVLDDTFGFYRSSYKVNDEIRWIGVTQFSSTFARRAFPCMDEPGFKAKFQLRIGHYENETVTSNTFQEVRNITQEPGYYITRFAKTPRMSTYLLGWTIHGFNRVNSPDPRFWLWTRYNNTELLENSPLLIEGPKIYSELETWMGIDNPIRKFEQFAVPDFYFNAMENWGFITFREAVPIMWPESTSLLNIDSNLITLAHEYAHTWFGNLVTPSFWNVAWLKEGFATYFSHLILSEMRKECEKMCLFPIQVLQPALLFDSENHNRTMNGRNVGSASSAKAVLDFVTYQKASSIIRMISDVIGESTFKRAMRSYLKQRQYKAANPSNLYKHLEQAISTSKSSNYIPVTVSEIIDSWANQTNYPLVRAARLSPNQLRVSQEPFQLNRTKIPKTDTRFWWIPVELITPNKGKGILNETSSWLGSEKSNILKVRSEASWFLLNPRQVGYYRVQYDAENWRALLNVLNSDEFRSIPTSARAALIDDIFNLARADFEKYDLALNVARYLKREDEYEPWDAASRSIILINKNLRDKPKARLLFQRFAIDLIAPIYNQLSFEERPSDSRLKRMQRNRILSTACSLGLDDCVLSAKSIFDNWIADENKPVQANLKSFVYLVGILNGTNNDWTNLWQRFLKTEYYTEKEPMMYALASSNNQDFITRYLNFSIQPDSDIAKQYRLTIIQSIVAASSQNIHTTLNYIEGNLHKIIQLRGIPFLEGALSAIGRALTSIEQANKFKLFIDRNAKSLGKAIETAKTAVKSGRDNIAWINECASQIINYLN